ncbi:hypothetical protein DSAG12_03858 [Promethearchaeum syntrophicum]|uniref:Polymerase beta nucleotidyltransferase domain-containing protein n=1 Tax=Promethearchaeum syntrophicum TaxID=2594042 RepID=A0A5B9DGZ4_9ARCH|nr:hypothetical protein [Candidatus Prometheoarchaeum syntrophicum]QEE18020.1 hypothetical protein DSAG12_03858 [Candidatus Prometheoarchaeum syntrophicum]
MELTPLHHQKLERYIDQLQDDPNILAMVVYGSATKSNKYNDIDIALIAFPEKIPYIDELKYMLGTNEEFDIHFLHKLPVYIQKDAIKGKLKFYKDYQIIFNVFINIIREWDDFHKRYGLFLEVIRDGL